MPSLKDQIASLAHSFSASVLAAIRGASLQEILDGGSAPGGPARRGPGRPRKATGGTTTTNPKSTKARRGGRRLARRSASDIQHLIGLIVGKLREHKAGLRSEQLQKVLQLSKKEIVSPLTQALAAKKITKKGQKRATTYHVAK